MLGGSPGAAGALLVHFLKWFRVSEADISKVTSDIYDTEIYGPTWVSFLYFINELGAWRKPRFLEEAQVLIAEVHLRHDHTIHDHPRTTQRPPAFRWFKTWSSPVSCLTSPISYLYLHCLVPAWSGPFVFINIPPVLLPAWSGSFVFLIIHVFFSTSPLLSRSHSPTCRFCFSSSPTK